jgi:hypothetical protein
MSEQRIYESIKYIFGGDEMRELGEALARETQTVYDFRAQKANAVSSLGASIKSAEKRAADLTSKINQGFELREVECMVLLETPRPGMKRLVRMDNNAHVRDEPMSLAEMQASFGFRADEGPDGKSAAAGPDQD